MAGLIVALNLAVGSARDVSEYVVGAAVEHEAATFIPLSYTPKFQMGLLTLLLMVIGFMALRGAWAFVHDIMGLQNVLVEIVSVAVASLLCR